MQKNFTQFKSVINEFESYFHFDVNCPIEVAKASLLECLKWIGKIEDTVKQAQEQANQVQKDEQKEITPEGSNGEENL